MTKTVDQILVEVHRVKPCSRAQLYRYFKDLKIQQAGAPQRPARYPEDSSTLILAHLGLVECAEATQKAKPEASGIVSMKRLRAERAKAQRRAA